MTRDGTFAGLTPNRVAAFVFLAFGVLLAASVVQDIILYSASPGAPANKIWLFDVDVERSLYTWLSSIVLYTIAGLLILLGLRARADGQRYSSHWLLLGFVFILLSADEAVSIHEKISGILTNLLDTSGVFYFAWTIPALILVGAGFVFYVPFLLSLPRRVSVVMVVSAAIYIAGAIGMELVAGGYVQDSGVQTLGYRALANLEEALEGIGLAIFLWCLLRLAFGTFPQPARASGPVWAVTS